MQDVLRNTSKVTGAVNVCLGKRINFAIFRLPSDKKTTLIIQHDDTPQIPALLSNHIPAKGFLIAPFTGDSNEVWLIRPDMVFEDFLNADDLEKINRLPDRKSLPGSNAYPGDTDKVDYINLINTSIQKIKSGDFDKVVLSRVKSVEGNFMPFMQEIFETLCAKYPNAFVYLFNVAGECWTGATPEPFLSSENRVIKTVSLAGTRTYRDEDMNITSWNSKELKEQEYVTLHIEKILNDFHIDRYNKNGPYVARAGNLLHLRTDFEFALDAAGSKLPALIHALHPTPAVCGMATGKAMDFIRNSEKHNREYYAGFLGPVGLDEQFNLFVNLRCMKVYGDRLVLYIGGGITRDSVAEEEWDETEIKAETVLSVLKKLR